MTSRRILAIHTGLLVFFVIGSLTSTVLAVLDLNFFVSTPFFLIVIFVMLMFFYSWKIFGDCPFTVWENQLRAKESLQPYQSSCIPQYSKEWFGLDIGDKMVNITLIFLFLLPVVAGLLVRLNLI